MAPKYDRAIGLRFDIPPEQAGAIASLKPHLFKRQAAETFPVPILPGIGMEDEELVKDAHRGRIADLPKEEKARLLKRQYFHFNELTLEFACQNSATPL